MADVDKVRSSTGVQYGFEDTVARERAEEAVDIANQALTKAATSKNVKIEGDILVISGGNNA